MEVHQHELTLALSPALTTGDPARLRHVVTNLLSNAIKYTPTGGRLEIRTSTDSSAGLVTLCVSDNGIGIDPADRPLCSTALSGH